MVRQENRTLSDSVTVRPGWCRKTSPTMSSSNSLPGMASLLGSRLGRCWESVGGGRGSRRRGSAAGGATEGGGQLVHHRGTRRHPPEQALEVLARRVVQALARSAAAVLDEEAAVAAVGSVPRGALDAGIGRHAREEELLHSP